MTSPAQANAPGHTAIRTRTNCRQLFVLFQGQAGRMMMDPLQFLHETGLTDRNLIVLRDVTRRLYQFGLGPDVPDIPSLIAWQQELIAKMPHVRDVYCVGSSSGAYAAMLCGYLLRAREVYAFAPPTDLTRWLEEDKIECQDRTFADLVPLMATSNGVTRYHVYYNESMGTDRESALRVRDCPGVELHPQGGSGHGVVLHLGQTGQLRSLLPAFAPV